MGSYINSTDSSPWDQMIVVSQKVINESFQNMWQLAQLDDAASPLKHYERTTRAGEYLKFDVGVPSVQLQTVPKDELLYFMLRMTGGSCFIYLTDDENDDTHIDWEINDWVFAFSVDIGESISFFPRHSCHQLDILIIFLAQKTVDKESQEYQDFKNRSGLLNWDFSLACLFIDTSCKCSLNPLLACSE